MCLGPHVLETDIRKIGWVKSVPCKWHKIVGYGNVILLNNNHESILLEAVLFAQYIQAV